MLPLQDNRAIQRHAGFTVLAQRFEVMFRDGSTVGLHPVAQDGEQQMFLRAVQTQGLMWCIFDVRTCGGRDIEDDIKRCGPRDAPGVVFYTLRGRYISATAFLAAATEGALQAWWPMACAAPTLGDRLVLA
jgi:hypothetical protein